MGRVKTGRYDRQMQTVTDWLRAVQPGPGDWAVWLPAEVASALRGLIAAQHVDPDSVGDLAMGLAEIDAALADHPSMVVRAWHVAFLRDWLDVTR